MSQMRRTRITDYLDAIDRVCHRRDLHRAPTGEIAAMVGVSKGTASSMLKALSESGFVDLAPYEGAHLTKTGIEQLQVMRRRNILIAAFLGQTLQLAPEVAAEEAWRLEPAASDRLITAIAAYTAACDDDRPKSTD